MSIEAGMEVCLKVVRDVHLSVKEGNTEPLESETSVNEKWISSAGEHLQPSWGGQKEARPWGAQWVGKKWLKGCFSLSLWVGCIRCSGVDRGQ